MTSEKVFQNYFIKNCKLAYRTSLSSGSGFPDCICISRDGTVNFVELKIIELGKKGNKKLGSLFKLSQPAWFVKFLVGGGKNLFVAFQIGKRYGLLKMTKDFAMAVDSVYYKDMVDMPEYREYDHIKELIGDIEHCSLI